MVEINSFYDDKALLKQVKEAFSADPDLPAVALGNFLSDSSLDELDRKFRKGWKHTTIPDRFSHSCKKRLKSQDAIAQFVKKVTGKSPLRRENMRLSHRDFTILHDDESQPAGILCFLFLDDWHSEWGGDIVFTKEGALLGRFTPARNTLLIVQRKKRTQMFIKYVNHKAKKNTLRILSA